MIILYYLIFYINNVMIILLFNINDIYWSNQYT